MYDYSDSDFSRKTFTILELQALMSRVGARVSVQKSKLIKIQEIKFLKSNFNLEANF
jgi:hypothetical protein